MEPHQPTRENLLADFEIDEAQCFSSGRLNNITDIGLSILAVVGSLVATVLAGAHVASWIVATFASIPAASASLQRIVDFRGRSIWYFAHSAKLTALIVSLKYANNPNLEEFARKRADLEVEADKRWGQIGTRKEPSIARRVR